MKKLSLVAATLALVASIAIPTRHTTAHATTVIPASVPCCMPPPVGH